MSTLRDKIKKEQEEQRKLREEGKRRMEGHRNRSLADTLRKSAEDDPLFGTREEGEDPAEARARSKADRAAGLNSLADRIDPPATSEEPEAAPDTGGFRPTVSGRPTDQTNEMERQDLAKRLQATNSIPPGPTNTPTPPRLEEEEEEGAEEETTVDPWTQLQVDRETAKTDLKKEKDNLSLREAIENVANGLGKIGAGMYGNKVGTDMSGLKFDKQDWDRKRDSAQKQYQIDMADVGERRKEQLSKENNAEEMKYRNSVLDETKRHNKAMEKLGGAKVSAAGAAALKKAGTAEVKDFKKKVEAVSAELYDISKNLESDSITEDVASQRIQSLLQNQLDVPPEMAKQITADEEWFFGILGGGLKDVSEIQSKVNAIAVQRLGANEIRTNSNLEEGEVAMTGPDGETYRVPEDQADAYAAEGYKRI